VEVLHHLFLWLWDMWPRKYNFTRIKKKKGKIKENRIFVNVGDDDDPRERR
jgi:hypothetical protein